MFRVMRNRPPTPREKRTFDGLASEQLHIVERAAGIFGCRFNGVRAFRTPREPTMKEHPGIRRGQEVTPN